MAKKKFKYSYYVYSAGQGEEFPMNEKSNMAALKAIDFLQTQWDLNACIHGHYPDVTITKFDKGSNLEIRFDSNTLTEFCDAIKQFSREYTLTMSYMNK